MNAALYDESVKSIMDFLKLDKRNVKPEEFGRFQAAANMAIRTIHEERVDERELRNQRLRAISMAFVTPKEREDYIRRSTAGLFPESKPKLQKQE
jgi:hypothetical protein